MDQIAPVKGGESVPRAFQHGPAVKRIPNQAVFTLAFSSLP